MDIFFLTVYCSCSPLFTYWYFVEHSYSHSREVGRGLGGASRNDFIALLGYYSPIVPVHLTLISASNKPPVGSIKLVSTCVDLTVLQHAYLSLRIFLKFAKKKSRRVDSYPGEGGRCLNRSRTKRKRGCSARLPSDPRSSR